MSLIKIMYLFNFEKGILQSSKCREGKFHFITAASQWKTHNEYTHDCEALVFAAAASGSLGRTHYINGKFISSDLCFIITVKDQKKFPIDLKFYHMLFNEFKNDIVNNTKAGTSKEAIGMKAFGNYRLPYFEIDKQIQTKIKFENVQKSKIILSEEFNNQLNLVKQLRQAFLREAMLGKLCKSVNVGETGQQLLAKINAEKARLIAEKKIKKEINLPLITEKEIPFEIPEHWLWCRLGNILTEIKYGTSQSCDFDSNKNSAILRIPNISGGEINIEDLKYTDLSDKEKNDLSLQENDILIIRSNGSRDLVGKTVLVKKEFIGFCYAGYLIRLRYNSNMINPSFLWLVTKSPYFRELIETPLRTTVGINNINSTEIALLKIPLPPIKEQEQIVVKLENLMKFCDNLEKSIKESQDYNDILLQQILKESLEPKEKIKSISIQSKKIENPLKTILGGHIIKLNNTTDFGRVKFQKLLFLTEYICKIDFDSNYVKKVAGPYDDSLIKNIEADFNRMRFFNVVQDKTDKKRVRYTALPGANELENLFLENFPDESVTINSTLLKFRPLNMGECELIATLYAVWNNRIIKNEPITDELLYSDFMEWDEQKKKYHSVFYKWLFWMKEEGIIPDGWGKYIEKPNSK